MKQLLKLVPLLIFIFSCSSPRPEGVLNEQDMKSVLKDMHLANAYLNTLPMDSMEKVAPVYFKQIFKNHQTDYRTFEKSLRYYSEQPILLDSMYSQIAAEYRALEKQVKPSSKTKPVE